MACTPDRLLSTVEYLESHQSKFTLPELGAVVDALSYNDCGLICAQIRAHGYTALAQRIEARRFK